MEIVDLQIRVNRWTLVSVAGAANSAFGYTLGLVENFDHPDVIVMDLEVEAQRVLLDRVVEIIDRHGMLDPAAMARDGIRWAEVHPDHLTPELFGTWAARYGGLPKQGQVVQIFAPKEWFCSCHKNAARRLDRPGPLPRPPAVAPTPRPANKGRPRRRR